MSVIPSFNIEIQDRDLDLLKGLFESRLMTLAQATAIHFGGNAEAAKQRIHKLKKAGYIAERPRRAYEPSILFLTRKAFSLLADGGHLEDYPSLVWTNLEKRARVSELTLAHELSVMTVKAAFFTALAQLPRFRISAFITWPLLYEFHARPGEGSRSIAVRPDGYARIYETETDGADSEHLFFLEVDRSTEVLDTLVTRALCYRDYYRRGGLAARDGRPPTNFEDYPFRVLIVVRNAERRNNLAERLLALRPPILTQVWLSTLPEVTGDPTAAVWIHPLAYRDATAGTPFAPAERPQEIYRRNVEREAFIEARIDKLTLFTK